MNRYILLIGILALTTLSMAKSFKKPSPTSALEFQQSSDTKIAVESGFLRFYTDNTERMTLDTNGNLGLGTTTPGTYKLNVNGTIMSANSIDIGSGRPAGTDDEGLYIKGTGSTPTNFQFASKSWSSSHAILFNAYKNATQSNGNLAVDGNTKYATAGDYNRGAAMIHYYGHNGGMGFYISGTSTGIDDDISWGTPKIQIQRNGNVGIDEFDPIEKLHVTDGDIFIGRNATNDPESGRLRITERVDSYQGGYMHYDGDDNILNIGVHNNNNTTLGDDFDAISIVRTNGKVGIRTTTPAYPLDVNGTINATTYRASGTVVWPDFVFEDTYELNDLGKVEKFIETNHHLPEIPSEAEVKENGLDLVEMQAKLLQKIEELTLYMIEQNKQIEDLKKENIQMNQQIKSLQANK